jgi:hypothetical protein
MCSYHNKHILLYPEKLPIVAYGTVPLRERSERDKVVKSFRSFFMCFSDTPAHNFVVTSALLGKEEHQKDRRKALMIYDVTLEGRYSMSVYWTGISHFELL